MKTNKKWFAAVVAIIAFVAFVAKVNAITPMLSISPTYGTDSATLSITGDANSSVVLYYYTTSYGGIQNRYLGSTNSSGYLSVTASASSYGITPGGLVYVIVNNQQSQALSWPTTYSSSNFYLSQTSLSLYGGQTSSVTAYNTYGTLYLSSNSNQGVATASISGNTISVYGQNPGSTTMTFCQNNYSSSCSTLYVTVTGPITGNTSNLGISSLILPVGSSATISSTNSSGLYVSSNSNRGVASTTASALSSTGCIAGSMYNVFTGQPCYGYGYGYNSYASVNDNKTITISALSVGTSTLTLCQGSGSYYTNSCSTVYVTVVGGYTINPSYYSNTSYSSYPYSSTVVDPYSAIPIIYSR